MESALQLPNAEKCLLITEVLSFIEENPERVSSLRDFLRDGRLLYGVKDVARMTNWSEGHIRKLCQSGQLPHIPGKEIRFIVAEVRKALLKMQCGGEYKPRGRIRRKLPLSTIKKPAKNCDALRG